MTAEEQKPRQSHRTVQLSPSFGRQQEIEAAQDLIDAAQAGEGRAIVVWGEAGIGKSNFVNQLMSDCEDMGFLVVSSRCTEFESSSAYQPFRDVLQVIARPEDEFVRHSTYLRRILYGTSERDEPIRDPDLFQTELFNESYRLFLRRSRKQPLLVCVEDFHDADADSIRMFHFLARRVNDLNILLLATVRTESRQDSQLHQLASSLRRDNQVAEFNLGPLDDQAMTQLIESLFGSTDLRHPCSARSWRTRKAIHSSPPRWSTL